MVSGKLGPNTWRIMGVPDRTGINFDVANLASELDGCVGLGCGLYDDLRGVSSSRDAFGEFYDATKGSSHERIFITEGRVSI